MRKQIIYWHVLDMLITLHLPCQITYTYLARCNHSYSANFLGFMNSLAPTVQLGRCGLWGGSPCPSESRSTCCSVGRLSANLGWIPLHSRREEWWRMPWGIQTSHCLRHHSIPPSSPPGRGSHPSHPILILLLQFPHTMMVYIYKYIYIFKIFKIFFLLLLQFRASATLATSSFRRVFHGIGNELSRCVMQDSKAIIYMNIVQ